MILLRLLILGILLYIGYRLLTGGRRQTGEGGGCSFPGGGQPPRDVLVEDPQCHRYVPKAQAVQLYHENTKYYFCSPECCEKFLKEKGDG